MDIFALTNQTLFGQNTAGARLTPIISKIANKFVQVQWVTSRIITSSNSPIVLSQWLGCYWHSLNSHWRPLQKRTTSSIIDQVKYRTKNDLAYYNPLWMRSSASVCRIFQSSRLSWVESRVRRWTWKVSLRGGCVSPHQTLESWTIILSQPSLDFLSPCLWWCCWLTTY